MSLMQRVCKSLGMLGVVLAVPTIALSQSSYVPQAGEYAPVGTMAGDQSYPAVSVKGSSGFTVWQDNITDGSGLGISAVRLDGNFNAAFASFRVNQVGENDQENPKVAALGNGGAVFVWQGGKQGFQHIYARFLSSGNTWITGDVMASTATNVFQVNPVVTALTNGNVVVAWSSWNQDGSMQGIYAQQFTASGSKVGSEFRVSQATQYNQRTPSIAGLADGGYVVAWVSEQQRWVSTQTGGTASVDIYARRYNSGGAPGNEFLVNLGTNVCANPTLAAAADGGFGVAWSQMDGVVANNSWDIFGRTYSSSGLGGTLQIFNGQRYGDQFGPEISACGNDYMVVWTSLAQDGSAEGVFGRLVQVNGTPAGEEFKVNRTTLNRQMQPAISSDGSTRFLVVWTGYVGGPNSFDLYAQRYATFEQPLLAPAKPFVIPISASRLSVAWPMLSGFAVHHWELYVDGSMTPATTTTNFWTMTNLSPDSTHSFRLAYVLTDGRKSPLSTTATGTTWGEDNNADGIPDDWQELYWGANPSNWPAPNTKLANGGPTVLQVFQSGSNPMDPATWFVAKSVSTSQGNFLVWNTQPGCVYQVMVSAGIPASWSLLGTPRFAAGTNDSIFLGHSQSGYYKVSRLRY